MLYVRTADTDYHVPGLRVSFGHTLTMGCIQVYLESSKETNQEIVAAAMRSDPSRDTWAVALKVAS
jgi:hypothetical protein